MLEDRICLVTGASQGMGRAAAIEMARQGAAAVAIVDIDREGGNETAALVRAEGAKSLFIACDLRDRDQISESVTRTVSEFGGLDVLHNNAGVLERAFTNDVDFDTLPEQLWDLVFSVNLKAMWLATKFAAPHLRRSTRGPAIVNAASVGGRPAGLQSPPMASRRRRDTADQDDCGGVGAGRPVQLLLPGDHRHADGHRRPRPAGAITGSRRWPRNLIPRRGTVEEVAKLVCFLASPDATFITGADYLIDGGSLAWRGLRPS